jgi:N-6 DNA Methylase
MGLTTETVGDDVRALLEGQQFAMAGLHGVVEADFFDWPAATPQGEPIIAGIARRLSTFAWGRVEHDVLKDLYESVIDAETRRKLGEYYTPDWLANKIVDDQFREPLGQRLLDPACGSGTFLFWAIRRLLAACDASGISNPEALERVVDQVQGIDLHPVAVTLARVTYLLALTPERLEGRRGEITVPVFLGDSVRWDQPETVSTRDGMTVRTTDPGQLLGDELHFPEGILEEPQRFDRLVAALASRAGKERRPGTTPGIIGLLNRHRVMGTNDRAAVELAFKKLCRLYDAGRDHVWSYYIRNLARPMSFSRPGGRADVLVGNPPWLAYRSMPPGLQATYQQLARERGLWAGGKVATQQDLSDLFVVRSVEQYLKPGGRFQFVMPYAVLSRRQFAGFRSGAWVRANARLNPPEEFARVKPPLFQVPSAVVAGAKTDQPSSLPRVATTWRGTLPNHHLDWASAANHLRATEEDIVEATDSAESPYRALFTNGATLYPRKLVIVQLAGAGPLGGVAGTTAVRSAPSSFKRKPWWQLPDLVGAVEEQFVMPTHFGATIVAFRARDPELAIVPWVDSELLDVNDDRLDEFPGLASWWRQADEMWRANSGANVTSGLLGQIDYQGKLRKQFPPTHERVVYTKSGQHLAACRIENAQAVIDHTLYWAPVASANEGRYLCAILNSQVLAEVVVLLQARGQHNPRHFDMHVFALPFPTFDPLSKAHLRVAALAERAERVAAGVSLDESWQFQKARRIVRNELIQEGVAAEIELAVSELLADDLPTPDLMGALSPAELGLEQPRGLKRGGERKQKARITSSP